MFKKFLPQEFSFYDYFEQHAEISVKISNILFDCASGTRDIESSFQEAKKLEQNADDVTHKCIAALQKTFITPIDRTDIHRLMKRMDDIVDSIDSAMTRIHMYDIKEIRNETKGIAEILVKCTNEILKALKGLRNMKHHEVVDKSCSEIHELENVGDVIHRSAIQVLFQEKDAVVILKWKEILDRLERAIDRCEDVANIIEGVIISAT